MHKLLVLLTVQHPKNVGSVATNRDYIKESIRFIKKWRELNHSLKDIKIVINEIAYNEYSLPTNVLDIYKELGVEYILTNKDKIEDCYTFTVVHETGKNISKIYNDYIILHFDLDMIILRDIEPIISNFIQSDKKVLCGVYGKNDYGIQRKPLYSDKLLNTDFIVTKPPHTIYTDFLSGITLAKERFNIDFHKEYDIEEYGCDMIYEKNKEDFYTIENYEQGEGYTNTDIEKTYFWHEHIYINLDNIDNTDLYKQYLNLKKNFRRLGLK